MTPTRSSNSTSLAQLLSGLVSTPGFGKTALPGICLMHSRERVVSAPVSYGSSIIFIAQGSKQGRLGGRCFTYDSGNYLVLSVPLPFECETFGSPEEPMLGMAIHVNPATVAELILEIDAPYLNSPSASPAAIDATPLTPELANAAVRLAKCLYDPAEAQILGPQIIREITYRALRGERGAALQALAMPQSNFAQIARALRRIHQDYARPLDVSTLAKEAGMSVSTFHAHFKAVTAKAPLQYMQTIRLHKAQVLIVTGTSVGEAAFRVGYESASQFSREFKRLFGCPPKEIINRRPIPLSMELMMQAS